jgi:hypothetical protein
MANEGYYPMPMGDGFLGNGGIGALLIGALLFGGGLGKIGINNSQEFLSKYRKVEGA